PAYHGPELEQEIEEILELQTLLKDNPELQADIEAEIEDIYTPFLDQLTDVAGLPGSVLRIMNLMDMAGYVIAYHLKAQYQRPRPHVQDYRVEPSIPVPTHSAYPSAHAVQTHLIAHGLAEVYEGPTGMVAEMFDVAERVSVNREIAGMHYPTDTEAGRMIAQVVFPMLRVMFDEVFVDAVAEANAGRFDNCKYSIAQTHAPKINPPDNGGDDTVSPKDTLSETLKHLGLEQVEKDAGKGVSVMLVDKAVDVDHPALEHKERPDGINLDYPVPAQSAFAMGSMGTGHGTAMAGLITGLMPSPTGDTQIGVAPGAFLQPMRAQNLARDNPIDRALLAGALLDAVLGARILEGRAETEPSSQMRVLVLSLDFQRPAGQGLDPLEQASLYVDVGAYLAEKDEDKRAQMVAAADGFIDPLVLVIAVLQQIVSVVIAGGNNGYPQPAYPGAPKDYRQLAQALEHEVTRKLVREQMLGLLDESGAFEFTDAQKDEVMTFLASVRCSLKDVLSDDQTDPFAKTGLIVVGAADYSDPGNRYPAKPTRYSNTGAGITLVAPGDGDDPKPLPQTCQEALARRTTIPTAEIAGPGGYASDADALLSSSEELYGFGGTSAASALTAGAVARIWSEAMDSSPSQVRATLLSDDYTREIPDEGGLRALFFKATTTGGAD
ncbi:MAG: S8 family serine peptidase, partial [Pseudomonadota bacterium]